MRIIPARVSMSDKANSRSNHPDGEIKVSGIWLTFTSQKGTDEINAMSKFHVFIIQAAGNVTADISSFAKRGTCHRQEVIFHFIIFSAAIATS